MQTTSETDTEPGLDQRGSGGGRLGGRRDQGGYGGGGEESDPWAADGPGGYSDEPPF